MLYTYSKTAEFTPAYTLFAPSWKKTCVEMKVKCRDEAATGSPWSPDGHPGQHSPLNPPRDEMKVKCRDETAKARSSPPDGNPDQHIPPTQPHPTSNTERGGWFGFRFATRCHLAEQTESQTTQGAGLGLHSSNLNYQTHLF
jgi:hypothetical protein